MRAAGAGRAILRGIALVTLVGGFAADWNRTHMFNPNWPPHAKFHDAMTICLGVFLGATSLVLLRRPRDDRPTSVVLGALLPALFWLAQALSFAFPNTGGIDAEFPELVPRLGGLLLNELPFSIAMLAISAGGLALSRR
jgi:hypothetical protein